MTTSTDKQLPEISYPALYVFRVICKSDPQAAERIRGVVSTVMGPIAEEAVTTRPSRGDQYLAVHVTCLLSSEEQRKGVYSALKADTGVVLSL